MGFVFENMRTNVYSPNSNLFPQGIVLHEMMHTMGFYHEMQRGDRNKFINVKRKNVQKGNHTEHIFSGKYIHILLLISEAATENF